VPEFLRGDDRAAKDSGASAASPEELETFETCLAGRDEPGTFVLLADADLTAECSGKGKTVIGEKLATGTIVDVTTVVHLPDQECLRGHLQAPAVGWISLLDTWANIRWARLQARNHKFPEGVPEFLHAYGYRATDASTWLVAPPGTGSEPAPRLELHVTGHEDRRRQTWYTIVCTLERHGCTRLEWRARRRVSILRDELYSRVKFEIGQCKGFSPAARHFEDVPFALKGGLPGTTTRLDSWFGALAVCINTGGALPATVARVVQFLEAPWPKIEVADTFQRLVSEECDEFEDVEEDDKETAAGPASEFQDAEDDVVVEPTPTCATEELAGSDDVVESAREPTSGYRPLDQPVA